MESAKIPLEALENKIPLMLKFLANEDDDVSGAVTQLSHDYITTLKQLTPLADCRKQLVKVRIYWYFVTEVITSCFFSSCFNFNYWKQES